MYSITNNKQNKTFYKPITKIMNSSSLALFDFSPNQFIYIFKPYKMKYFNYVYTIIGYEFIHSYK